MRKINQRTDFSVFAIFFGVSLIEAFREGNWLKSVFWFAINIVFFGVITSKENGMVPVN
ncbi:hypothetical protein [Niabella aquatica]